MREREREIKKPKGRNQEGLAGWWDFVLSTEKGKNKFG